MVIDLSEWTSRLERLTHESATDQRRAEVEEALRSKWEGIQVWAGRVLAAWGDPASVERLRGWLESNEDKEAGWAVRGEAVRCLCECYRPEDISWLLDKYFNAHDRLGRYEFFPVITALPEDIVRARINLEAKSKDPSRREAAQFAENRIESEKRRRAATAG